MSCEAAFAAALPEPLRDSRAWLPRVRAAARRARDFLGADLDAVALGRFLAERVLPSDPEGLEPLELEALAVSFAALSGGPRAIEAVEAELQLQLRREARRLRAEAHADETAQRVRELLLTSGPRRKPALTQYSGRGELGAFVRVIAVRELVRLCRSPRDAETLDAATLDGLRVSGDDPELQVLRAQSSHTFRAAFAAAMHALEASDRRLLKRHFVGGESLDLLAAAHGVHRATVARWLVRARAEVARRVREHLRHEAGLSCSELDSLLRTAVSRMDVSLKVFHTPVG